MFIGALLLLLARSAEAQIINPKKVLQRKLEQKTNEVIEGTVDKAVDSAFEAGKPAPGQEAQAGAPTQGEAAAPDAATAKGSPLQVYSKFDFIPGEKVVFFDDFTAGSVGDFPVRWNTNGSGEIVTTSLFPGRWLQMKGEGYYIAETGSPFPENFTAEFDIVPTNESADESGRLDFGFYVVAGDFNDPNEGGAIPGKAGIKLNFDNWSAAFASYADGTYKSDGRKDVLFQKNHKYHLSVWVQKQRLRLYINEQKVFDIPRGLPEGFRYNLLRFELGDESQPMITNFRVAAGLPDLRHKLLTEGKIVSYGIYFDVNKDVVKPESYGSLKEIAAILKENPAVKIRIVGHTDGDGADATNLDLSKRRAAAVKTELVKTFGIDGTRMQTDGLGETKPVATNDTPSNKALNRRVEFIRL
jgi:outer membrane protein OmpA-like peptidoglycan-associated protein